MDLIAKAQEVKKALLAAAGVGTAIVAVDGVPEGVKAWILKGLGILATYGVVWVAKNKPS